MDQPNPLRVFFSVVRSLITVSKPAPNGAGTVSHEKLAPIFNALGEVGLPAVAEWSTEVESYLVELSEVEPNELRRTEALAYWLNLYNAGAIRLAIEAHRNGETSVLRVPGAFTRPVVNVDGEDLSLDAIEHAKVRRFGDPRIHGALVCGSLSCPTLRPEPYTGDDLDGQLEDQMRKFLEGGGVVADGSDRVLLSRVFLWYGADFVRPERMPTFIPATKRQILEAVQPWLPDSIEAASSVEFQPYDWSLACAVG